MIKNNKNRRIVKNIMNLSISIDEADEGPKSNPILIVILFLE